MCFDAINVHALLAAYHQVPSVSQSQQESGQCSKEHGQVFVVPDSGRHPLSTFQLGAAQRSGKMICKKNLTDICNEHFQIND